MNLGIVKLNESNLIVSTDNFKVSFFSIDLTLQIYNHFLGIRVLYGCPMDLWFRYSYYNPM